MFTTILMFILSYLIGSLVPGFWVGKIFYHKDIRDEGQVTLVLPIHSVFWVSELA